MNRQVARFAEGRGFGFGRIDGIERGFPGGLEIVERLGFAVEDECWFGGGGANGLGVEGRGEIFGVFDEETEIALGDELVRWRGANAA